MIIYIWLWFEANFVETKNLFWIILHLSYGVNKYLAELLSGMKEWWMKKALLRSPLTSSPPRFHCLFLFLFAKYFMIFSPLWHWASHFWWFCSCAAAVTELYVVVSLSNYNYKSLFGAMRGCLVFTAFRAVFSMSCHVFLKFPVNPVHVCFVLRWNSCNIPFNRFLNIV